MSALSQAELQQTQAASTGAQAGDMVVHWQSTFGLIVIEVRGGQAFVNGDLVTPHHVVKGGQANQASGGEFGKVRPGREQRLWDVTASPAEPTPDSVGRE